MRKTVGLIYCYLSCMFTTLDSNPFDIRCPKWRATLCCGFYNDNEEYTPLAKTD